MTGRYLVFGGSVYYPAGGALDYLTSRDDRAEAIAFAEGFIRGDSLLWAHVADSHDGMITWKGKSP